MIKSIKSILPINTIIWLLGLGSISLMLPDHGLKLFQQEYPYYAWLIVGYFVNTTVFVVLDYLIMNGKMDVPLTGERIK